VTGLEGLDGGGGITRLEAGEREAVEQGRILGLQTARSLAVPLGGFGIQADGVEVIAERNQRLRRFGSELAGLAPVPRGLVEPTLIAIGLSAPEEGHHGIRLERERAAERLDCGVGLAAARARSPSPSSRRYWRSV
jgi:hypothetical protein